ncbi:MAG: hypothetical protein J5I93_03770 [Pirellulaceae bacterium]|nr:hypothetical protein [Pirellulaceae bacterium]
MSVGSTFAGPLLPGPDWLDLRLRIVWGSGASRRWSGSIRLDQGGFSEFRLLGLEADEPGSMRPAARLVSIDQPGPRAYDGIDLRVVAPRTARLLVELTPQGEEQQRRTFEMPLSELIDQFRKEPLDDQENRLLIRRQPGDKLRVTLDQRDNLVFSPGEQLVFHVQPHELGGQSAANRCRLGLVHRSTGNEVWTAQHDLRTNGAGFEPLGPLTLDLPAEEGVYDLVIGLVQRRLTTPFGRLRSILERKVQLVVIGQQPPSATTGDWRQIAEIDASSGNWWERMTRIPNLLPGFSQGPIHNGLVRQTQWNGRPMMELSVNGWQAYPLPIDRVGQPHVVVVEYPRQGPQSLGISIVEPDAAGKVLPIGLDSGVAVEDSADAGDSTHEHRLIFWPRTRTPLLLLTNRHSSRPAVFGAIRLLAGPEALPAAGATAGSTVGPVAGSTAGPAALSASGERLRQLVAYFDKPLFPENFSAAEVLDEQSGQTLDDWQTFYQGGRRLMEYLRHVGYQSAVVSVYCEGGTLYPSRVLEPTPKYDTGIFLGSGQDPLPKDALEMLFRMFDREGLTLVPALHFSGRLPELERLRREPADGQAGWELIDEEGRTWVQRHGTRAGQAPYYNPLDERVQQAMRRVVDELVARYAHHPSFGGIALQLGPETYTQFPGLLWGLDDQTIARFEQQRKVDVPGSGPGRFAQRAEYLRTTGRSQWQQWRSEGLARLHQQILEDMLRRRPAARLYLASADVLTSQHAQQALLPNITGKPDARGVLLQFGLDPELYQQRPGLIFLRPQRIAPPSALPEQAINLEVAQSVQLDELFGRFAEPGSLLFHESQPLRLASFDEKSPYGTENTYSYLVTHFAPAGDQARRRFVHSLAQLDAQLILDGGWMLPLGQEQEVSSILEAYRQLPAAPFETVVNQRPGANDRGAANGQSAADSQSLVVRRLVRGGQTYVYVVHDAPWPVTAELAVAAPPGCRLDLLAAGDTSRFEQQGTSGRWTVKLRPYDLVAGVFSAANVQVLQWRAVAPSELPVRLREEITGLRDRIKSVTAPRAMRPLTNDGFELEGPAEPLPGWLHATGPGIEVAPNAQQPFAGRRSLRVHLAPSATSEAWVRSEPIAVPETGRLRVSVWLRTSDQQRQPPLRLAVEGRLGGETYYRFANVGAENPQAQVRERWAEYQFVVDNLPLTGLSDLRVGFDLMGPGEVWIDEVRLFDLWFDKTERDELLKNVALADLQLDEGQLRDCQKFLDSYWARYLSYHVPLPEPAVAARPAVTPVPDAAPPPADSDTAPSLLDRFRQLVPRGVLPF